MAEQGSGLFDRVRRGVAIVGLLGLAIAAILGGSDRQSRDFPNSPSVVGWPYDTGAARAKAILAFVRSGPASAIGYAKRSVLSDPISAQAVSIVGRAELYSQHLQQARLAFEVSGQLGWRDAFTQIYWLDQALQSKDYRVAAERLDALLRQSPDDEDRYRFIAAMAATPEGRGALAKRLRLSPAWAQTLVTAVRDLPADDVMQRVEIMRLTGNGVWTCASTEQIVQRLIDLGMLDRAQDVWRLNCEQSNTLVYDGGFDKFDILQRSTAFDWLPSPRGDADISVVQDSAGGRSLAMEVSATVSLPVIRQIIVLKPGNYRLTWRTPGTNVLQARALHPSLSCKSELALAEDGIQVPGTSDKWSLDFTLGNDCQARQLIFWLAPKAAVRLDDVSLAAVPRSGTR